MKKYGLSILICLLFISSLFHVQALENISRYFQGAFDYIGHDLSANECIRLLDEGKIDLYTAAKKQVKEKKNIFSLNILQLLLQHA